jgi:hypothetical protein
MSKWHGVEEQDRIAWQKAFARKSDGVRMPVPCPVCGHSGLHRYFGTATAAAGSRPGFVGRGASWEWCSSCGTYEHASGLVPAWWAPLSVPNEHGLTAEPEELERQLRTIGLL